jgi:hypothetical protein
MPRVVEVLHFSKDSASADKHGVGYVIPTCRGYRKAAWPYAIQLIGMLNRTFRPVVPKTPDMHSPWSKRSRT